MQVITIFNRKGGIGKTATAHAVGAYLRMQGHKVLYIDLDSQCNLSFTLGADTSEKFSYNLFKGKDIKNQIISTEQGDIVPANLHLATVDQEETEPSVLKSALKPISKQYDYVIIDTPASLGNVTVAALTSSNKVIIPVQADVYSLQGLKQLFGVIKAIKMQYNSKLKVAGILLTRYSGRATISQSMLEGVKMLAKRYDTVLIDPPIRECAALKEAVLYNQDIFSYSPRCNASKDYKAACDQIFG